MTTQTCPACGREIDISLAVCPDDGSPLWGVPTVPNPTPTAPASPEPPNQPVAQSLWLCPTCARHVDGPECDFDGTRRPDGRSATPGAPVAPDYSEAPSASAAVLGVRLPDGAVIWLDDGAVLDLGRHSPDRRVAAALAAYEGVGRRHASLSVSGSQAIVVDHQSINGTRVNGVPVHGAAHVGVDALSTIHLGRYAVVHVSRPAGGPQS